MSVYAEALAAAVNKVRRILAPPPRKTVTQWADAYRVLSPESSARPGRYRSRFAPFQAGIMDAASDPTVERLVGMTSAQIGKTTILENILGYFVHLDPCPILVIQPTERLAETFSKDRLAPMVRDTAVLRDRIADPRARDSANTILHKQYPGGHLTAIGANAPAGLASRPIRVLLADEVDRYPKRAGTEGDPVALARKRLTAFWNRLEVYFSTPTIKGASRIESLYEESDQRRFEVPCPACDTAAPLDWKNVTWPKGKPEEASYFCETCGAELTDGAKLTALRAGRWVATAPFQGTAGFHLSELYSPWRTWRQIAAEFLEAKKDPDQLQVWVNTVLGETWEEEGETSDPDVLIQRREPYPVSDDGRPLLPADVLVLTAGIDTQDDRLEAEVVGWGHGEESFAVAYYILDGDPQQPRVWKLLDELLARTWTHETGAELAIEAACIDSAGHRTDYVYNYVGRFRAGGLYACIGRAGADRPRVSAPTKRKTAALRRPLNLYTVGVDGIKDQLARRLRVLEPGPGYCHWPLSADFDEEYFAQLTAEKKVARKNKGFTYYQWTPTRTRNEALDVRVLATAALVRRRPDFDALERRLEPTEETAPTERALEEHRRRRRTPGRSGFVNRW